MTTSPDEPEYYIEFFEKAENVIKDEHKEGDYKMAMRLLALAGVYALLAIAEAIFYFADHQRVK